MNNSLKRNIRRAVKKCLSLGIVLGLALSLFGCQLLSQTPGPQSSYGQYYLWLKTLTSEELAVEIAQQKQSLLQGNIQAEEYLLLLHSLPSSPIHNAYTAKSILNKRKNQYVESHYNPTNLALITVLKDQLNQQLLILKKLTDKTEDLQLSRKQQVALNKSNTANKALIIQLKQQIVQLKKIEKNINEHGQ